MQWVEDGLIGVAFDEPIDVVLLLSAPGDGPRPRMPRIEVDCTAWVREDGDVVRKRVGNIRKAAFAYHRTTSCTVGADVVVTLPGLAPAAAS